MMGAITPPLAKGVRGDFLISFFEFRIVLQESALPGLSYSGYYSKPAFMLCGHR